MEFCRHRARLFFLLLLFSKSPVIYFESRRKIKLKPKKIVEKNSNKNKKKPADWILCRHINTSARRSVNDNSFRQPLVRARVSRPVCIFFFYIFRFGFNASINRNRVRKSRSRQKDCTVWPRPHTNDIDHHRNNTIPIMLYYYYYYGTLCCIRRRRPLPWYSVAPVNPGLVAFGGVIFLPAHLMLLTTGRAVEFFL